MPAGPVDPDRPLSPVALQSASKYLAHLKYSYPTIRTPPEKGTLALEKIRSLLRKGAYEARPAGFEPATLGSEELTGASSQLLAVSQVAASSLDSTAVYGESDFGDFAGLRPSEWVQPTDHI